VPAAGREAFLADAGNAARFVLVPEALDGSGDNEKGRGRRTVGVPKNSRFRDSVLLLVSVF
jgi:hypothetical protein